MDGVCNRSRKFLRFNLRPNEMKEETHRTMHHHSNSREFSQKKNERHFVRRIFTISRQRQNTFHWCTYAVCLALSLSVCVRRCFHLPFFPFDDVGDLCVFISFQKPKDNTQTHTRPTVWNGITSFGECAFVVRKWFMVFAWCKFGVSSPFYLFISCTQCRANKMRIDKRMTREKNNKHM